MIKNIGLKTILNLGRVFWDSQAFLTACKLRIFDYLREPIEVTSVSKKLRTNERATKILLDALVSLGFVRLKGTKYVLNSRFSDFLLSDSDKNVLSILDHYYHMWDDWGKLIDSIKTGKCIEKKVNNELKRQYTKSFITGMDNLTKFQKERILNSLDLKGVKKILDIGSGPATYLREILKRSKNITATILDLPDAAEVGKEFIRKDNLEKRVRFIVGDIREKELDKDYDCVFIFQVLHALDQKTREIAINKAHKALNKGGKIYIHEFYLNEKKTYPKENVIFRLNMLIHADGGDNLSIKEIKNLLENAGFSIKNEFIFKNPSTVLIEGIKS